jgi:hypothetical protein
MRGGGSFSQREKRRDGVRVSKGGALCWYHDGGTVRGGRISGGFDT